MKEKKAEKKKAVTITIRGCVIVLKGRSCKSCKFSASDLNLLQDHRFIEHGIPWARSKPDRNYIQPSPRCRKPLQYFVRKPEPEIELCQEAPKPEVTKLINDVAQTYRMSYVDEFSRNRQNEFFDELSYDDDMSNGNDEFNDNSSGIQYDDDHFDGDLMFVENDETMNAPITPWRGALQVRKLLF